MEKYVNDWVSIEDNLPDLGEEVLIKCKGWDSPKIATYMRNPHCIYSDSIHVFDDVCFACCGIWMIFDSRGLGRVVNAPIIAWCKIPKITKNFK